MKKPVLLFLLSILAMEVLLSQISYQYRPIKFEIGIEKSEKVLLLKKEIDMLKEKQKHSRSLLTGDKSAKEEVLKKIDSLHTEIENFKTKYHKEILGRNYDSAREIQRIEIDKRQREIESKITPLLESAEKSYHQRCQTADSKKEKEEVLMRWHNEKKSIHAIESSLKYVAYKDINRYDFANDPESFSNSRKDTRMIDSLLNRKFKINDDFDFEFRLYERGAFGSGFIFILQHKDDQWHGQYFKYYLKKKGYFVTQLITPREHMEGFWDCLVQNKVLLLPDENSMEDKLNIFRADTTMIKDYYRRVYDERAMVSILDGASYIFRLQTKDRQRAYDYHCPKAKLERFSQTEEYYRAFRIIALVRKYAGLPMTCC